MKKIMLAVIIVIAAIHSASHSEVVANTETSRERLAPSHNPSLRELYSCADGSASNFFSEQSLIDWRRDNYGPIHKTEGVAVSLYSAKGHDGRGGRGFITLTRDKILFTPAEFKPHPYEWIKEHTNLTLNLKNKVDPISGIPIVDEQDTIKSSWAQKVWFTVHSKSGAHSHSDRAFGTHEFHGAVTEIKIDQSLTGESAELALRSTEQILEARILGTADRVLEIYRNRQSLPRETESISSFSNYIYSRQDRHISEFYLNDMDLEILRQGLCSCEFLAKAVAETRRKLTEPRSPIQVWSKGKARKLSPGDLHCGMV